MTRNRLSLAAAIGVVLLLTLAACGGGAEPTATSPAATPTATRPAAATPTSGPAATPTATPRPTATPAPQPTPTLRGPTGTLNIAVERMGAEAWVARFSSGTEFQFNHLVADPAIAENYQSRALEGRLVSAWSFQKVGTDNVWTFKLYPGIVINEGQGAFTSEDAKFNFAERFKADAFGLGVLQKLMTDNDLNNFEIVSPTEFRTHSTKLDAATPRKLAGLQVWQPRAYSEKVGDDGYNAHPIGTGSFIFRSGQKGSKYTLEAVPNHWRKTAGARTVNLLVAPEVATRVAMLNTGQADMSPVQPAFKRELGSGLRPFTVRNYYNAFVALGGQYYDLPDKLGTDPWVGYTDKARKVREALTIAIDRQAIVDRVLYGEGTPAPLPLAWPWPYEGQLFLDPNWKVPPYDPAGAKRLLAEAGYPNGFEMNYAIITGVGYLGLQDVGEAVAGYWEAIGIKVKRQVIEWAPTFRQKLNDRTTTGWVYPLNNTGTQDPVGTTQSKRGGTVYLHDPVFEKYALAGEAEPDETKRAALGRELGAYMIEQRLLVPLFMVHGVWGLRDKVVSWDYIAGFAYMNSVETIVLKQ